MGIGSVYKPSENFKKSPNRKGRWKKGESGNPGGRPKALKNVIELARQHTETAIKRLAFIVDDPKATPAAQCAAAIALLDRGYGRPAQSSLITVRRSVSELSDDELHALAAGADDETQIAEAEPAVH